MANNYYNFTTPFIPGTKVRSEQVNSNYSGIESGFDLLPTDPVSSIIGTSWFGTEVQGATVNEFQVTTPDPQTSVTNGQRVAFFATHTNTGAATLDVDGTGVFNMVNFNGSAFVGGEVVSGQWYEFVYDSANNFWLVAAAVDNALQVTYAQEWANNPVGTLVSAAAGGDQVDDYSALHWSTGSSEWATRAEDDPIPTQFGGDGVTDFSAFHWAQKAQAFAGLPVPTVANSMLRADNTATAFEETTLLRVGDTQVRVEGINLRLRTGGQFIINTDDDVASALVIDGPPTTGGETTMSFTGNATFLTGGSTRYQISEVNSRHVFLSFPIYIEDRAAQGSLASGFGQIWVREGAAGDPLFSEVELLADMDGPDGATSYTEISSNGFSAGFVGTAQLDTAQFNSGSASLLLDGNSDIMTYADNAAFDMGTGDWTVEGFVRFNTLPPLGASNNPGFCLFSQWGAAAGDQKLSYHIIQDAFGFRVQLRVSSGILEVGTISGGISTGVWYHWAVTRSSGDGNVRAYFNGNYETADFGLADANLGRSSEGIRIGSLDGSVGFHDGWIDDVRFTVGTARYSGTGAYTPPSTPYATGPGDQNFIFTRDDGTDVQLDGQSTPPGGADTNVQFNDGGVFGGDAELAWDGNTLTVENVGTAAAALAVNVGFNPSRAIEISSTLSTNYVALRMNDQTGSDFFQFVHDYSLSGPNHEFRLESSDFGTIWEIENEGNIYLGGAEGSSAMFLAVAGALNEVQIRDGATLFIEETSAANADNTGQGQLWVLDDVPNALQFTDDAGNIFPVRGTTAGITGADHGATLFGLNAGGVTQTRIEFRDALPAGATRNFYIGAVGTNQIGIVSENVAGRTILIASDDAGLTQRTILNASPDSTTVLRADTDLLLQAGAGTLAFRGTAAGVASMHQAGTERFRTGSTGMRIIGSAATTSSMDWANNSATTLTTLGHVGSNTFVLENTVTNPGVAFRFVGEDVATITRTMLEMNPNTGPELFESGVSVARVLAAASGGFEINNTLTGAGYERALTESDVPGSSVDQRFVKTADETIANTTTFQNDNHLTGMALAVGKWGLYGSWRGSQPAATTGLKFRWTNSGGTFDGDRSYAISYRADTGASPANNDIYYTTIDGVVGALINALNTGEMYGYWTGHIGVGTSTKTLTLQWAQVVANVGNSTLSENTFQQWSRND